MATPDPKHGDLRVWWITNPPGPAEYHPVASAAEAAEKLRRLGERDLGWGESCVYANAGGLEVFDAEDTGDGPSGSWVEWYDDETGYDIDQWAQAREEQS